MAKRKPTNATSHPPRQPRTSHTRPQGTPAGSSRRHFVRILPAPTRLHRALLAAAEKRPELHFGFSATRAVVVAIVICVLTLTIAGPVRTFFSQRSELRQQHQLERNLHTQIDQLRQQQANLEDPVYIKAQARERLGFVMPGETPFQVQLPDLPPPGSQLGTSGSIKSDEQPWYSLLWHSIAQPPDELSDHNHDNHHD